MRVRGVLPNYRNEIGLSVVTCVASEFLQLDCNILAIIHTSSLQAAKTPVVTNDHRIAPALNFILFC